MDWFKAFRSHDTSSRQVNALFELMEARLSATRTVHSGQNGDAVGAKTLESLFTQKDVMKVLINHPLCIFALFSRWIFSL